MTRILLIATFVFAGAWSAFGSIDTGLIALVPGNSTVVAGIDVEKSRSSDFGQFLLQQSRSGDAHFEEFMNETGFDPRRDLQTMVISSSGEPGERGSHGFAILARGLFDEDRLRAAAIAKGGKPQTYQGVQLVVHKDGQQTIALAFPETGVAVFGDLESAHQVIQNLSSPSSLDVELSNRIDQAGANDAWFASSTGGAMVAREFSAQSGGAFGAQQAQALKSVRGASGGVQFGSNVTVTFDAAARSEQDATSLADVVRFLASMVQMRRQADPRAAVLAASLDKMQLSTNGDTVHIAFAVPEKSLEQMASLGPQAGSAHK